MTHRRRSLRMAALVGILTVIAAVFVCSGAVLFAQRDHEGFAFVEQEGDASVLEDIRITGVLTDSFQRISFASQGRELTQRILPQALMDEVREKSHVVGYDYEPLPGTETKVQFYNAGEEIKNPDGSVNQADTSTISETADQFTLFLEDGFHSDFRIQTQIVYHKTLMQLYYADQNGKKGLMSRSGGFQPWDTVQLDGIRYTVTLTDENCRGTGGIYDMTDVPDSSSGEAVTIHKKNLFPIDLQNGKVETVSLEACGEQLALFLRQEGKLTVQLIDPRTWQATHTISIPGWEEYTFYTVKENIMLLADMHTSGEEVICEAIAVDLVEGAIVEQVEDTVSRGEAGDFCTGFADLHYAGGTLSLFTLMEQPKFTQSSGPVPRPYLIAYQDGQKVFSCSIQSGQQEDLRCETPNIRRYEALQLQKGGEQVDSD